ncbi:prevent-host-death family protein [Streptococcus gallinaceus]|uniref:type II toxin-antitoxin system prevent-host-death family antitoxin n=1 Tax=Streptococcus gallinaceus TaxID=165758 RepID=UPI0020A0A558|nr:type II toxin-antitoxin system prevent-host-death family antitoxin [Streptococcus gallinaceus]MCP1638571.1 prevent-host-death family protein [Streptococcus gallinaceus]MCP1769342.1 prevent-host-death family protein [Streptococcus gallinaceus]
MNRKKKTIKLLQYFNIGAFNHGQASKIMRELVNEDKVGVVNRNSKPFAVIISHEKYERLLEKGIDLNEY